MERASVAVGSRRNRIATAVKPDAVINNSTRSGFLDLLTSVVTNPITMSWSGAYDPYLNPTSLTDVGFLGSRRARPNHCWLAFRRMVCRISIWNAPAFEFRV